MSRASTRPRLAVTVDAEHPDRSRCSPGNCERLLQSLDRARIIATFFLQCRWVTAYPQLAREIAAQGHLIGNHSHFQAPMSWLSETGQEADVLACQEAIQSIVGVDPRPWFRSPFGAASMTPAWPPPWLGSATATSARTWTAGTGRRVRASTAS